MSRVLVLHAHPNPTRSRVNVPMLGVARGVEGVTAVDLYADYPRQDIDVGAEQKRLLEHDALVFQFPFHWYSTPPILKLWMDRVLEFGFAYGKGGDRLAGKPFLVATTAGGASEAYALAGLNRFPIRTLLSPLEQTAHLCGMRYLAPFVLFASVRAADREPAETHRTRYRELLEALVGERLDLEAATDRELLLQEALPIRPADTEGGA